jgi:hypothetical protein
MEMPNLTGVQLPQTPKGFDFKKSWPLLVGVLVVVVAGVGTAWLISGKVMGTNTGSVSTASNVKVSANEAGILNPNFKYDTAEGTLDEGGIGNEGTHHLIREGGPSKYVYLTSSVVDLQSFVGKDVEVWGETQASKKAGWLMDVVKIKVK